MTEMTLSIANPHLDLNRQIQVEATMSGVALSVYVHKALALKESVSALDGKMCLEISYQLFKEDTRLDTSEQSLAELGVGDRTSIELRVLVTQKIVVCRGSPPVDYRSDDEETAPIPPAILNRLLQKAFGHLTTQKGSSL